MCKEVLRMLRRVEELLRCPRCGRMDPQFDYDGDLRCGSCGYIPEEMDEFARVVIDEFAKMKMVVEGGRYVLKLDERGEQCLYDEGEREKLVCGDIYTILDYVRSRGGGTIYVLKQ